MDTDTINELVRRTMREEEGRAHHERSTPTPEPPANTPQPPKAEPVKVSDPQIAIELLTRETGSREKAIETLALDPTATASMKDAINKRRAELQGAEQERVTREWEASSEGRRVKAQATANAEAAQKQLAAQARALLTSEGEFAELAQTISDEEAIELAGLAEPEPEPEGYKLPEDTPAEAAARELLRTWHQKADHQRRAEAASAGLNYDELREIKAQDPNPNIFT